MRKNRNPSHNPKWRALLGSVAFFSIALGAPLLLGAGCKKAPAPEAPAEAPASPKPQAVPEADFEADLSNSITFMATVVEISPTSVTFESGGARTTLPITPSTRLVALQGIGDIRPNANIGIRVSADKKRLLVLNGTWME
jgi:hypothetical protein